MGSRIVSSAPSGSTSCCGAGLAAVPSSSPSTGRNLHRTRSRHDVPWSCAIARPPPLYFFCPGAVQLLSIAGLSRTFPKQGRACVHASRPWANLGCSASQQPPYTSDHLHCQSVRFLPSQATSSSPPPGPPLPSPPEAAACIALISNEQALSKCKGQEEFWDDTSFLAMWQTSIL